MNTAWKYHSFLLMTVRITSRFATPNETARVLGVSSKRVKELAKLIDANMEARRASGISWIAPAASRKAFKAAHRRIAKKKSKMFTRVFARKSSPGSFRIRRSEKRKAPLRKQRRAKKPKTAR
jgi:hypothetical protein